MRFALERFARVRLDVCERLFRKPQEEVPLCDGGVQGTGKDRFPATLPRIVPGHGMVRAETVDVVLCNVRGVREVPEVLGWHSDFPDFVAMRQLPVELLLRIDQHGHARHR